MLVKAVMIPKDRVESLQTEDSLEKALTILESSGLTAIPVLEGEKFRGLITRRRIFEGYFKDGGKNEGASGLNQRDAFLKDNVVKDFLITDIPVAQDDDLFDEIIVKFLNARFDFLPVLSIEGNLTGIVTRNNILNAFIRGMGLTKESTHRVTVLVQDTKGILTKLSSVLAKAGANVVGVVTFDPEIMNLKFIELAVRTDNILGLVKALDNSGFSVREWK